MERKRWRRVEAPKRWRKRRRVAGPSSLAPPRRCSSSRGRRRPERRRSAARCRRLPATGGVARPSRPTLYCWRSATATSGDARAAPAPRSPAGPDAGGGSPASAGAARNGRTRPALCVLSRRRNSKRSVEAQLGLPPQAELVHTLRLSSIERHFYAKQVRASPACGPVPLHPYRPRRTPPRHRPPPAAQLHPRLRSPAEFSRTRACTTARARG